MATVQSRDGQGNAWHLFGKPAMQRGKGTGKGNGNEELRVSPQGMLLLKARLVSSVRASGSGEGEGHRQLATKIPGWIFLQGSFSSRHLVHLAPPWAVQQKHSPPHPAVEGDSSLSHLPLFLACW